jgi:hypothetical protein
MRLDSGSAGTVDNLVADIWQDQGTKHCGPAAGEMQMAFPGKVILRLAYWPGKNGSGGLLCDVLSIPVRVRLKMTMPETNSANTAK